MADEKRKINLSMDDITLGDLEAFEEACGGDLMEALTPQVVTDADGRPVKDPDDPKGHPLRAIKVNARTMIGLVYVAMRRDNESITLAEVKRIPLTQLDFNVNTPAGGDEEDPQLPPSEHAESNDA